MLSVDKNVGGFLERAFAEGRVGHAYIVVGEKQYLSGLLAECAMVVLNPHTKWTTAKCVTALRWDSIPT